MGSEGAFDSHDRGGGAVPPKRRTGSQPPGGERYAAPRVPPQAPPMPRTAPRIGPSPVEWVRAPRPEAAPGIWRYEHIPKPPQEPNRLGDRQLLGGALLSLLVGLLVWSLCINGYIDVWSRPLFWLTPDSWWSTNQQAGELAYAFWKLLFAAVLGYVFGRIGRWPEVWRRFVRPRLRGSGTGSAADGAAAGAGAAEPDGRPGAADPAAWPEIRAAGQPAVADRLVGELTGGSMNDVDFVRIDRAWQSMRARPERLDDFAATVLAEGAAAWAHPSGARDLPVRAARHDLRTGQVRLGRVPDELRNPYAYRGVALALEPTLLSTSLLVVGPSGAGKTSRVVRPAVESLALQALAGRAAVVVVGSGAAELGPDAAYDVVIRPGDPNSAHDLDLYGGATEADEAAAVLAEALVDEAGSGPESGVRRAATALAQVIGPYRAAYGRFPSVPELRELLDGVPVALGALREACQQAGSAAGAALRELDARERQAGRPGDPGALLADRIALLDRPAFAGFFDTSGRTRPFSPRALAHPLRVRVDLPERGHAEASRLLARLLLAQFAASVQARTDRSLFACLVLDDAAHSLTPASVRAVQRLRTAHAGVVLALRTLDEVPESLRAGLVGAVGCRVVLSGVSTWDGEVFAQAWGRDWVQTHEVTHTPDLSGGLLKRSVRGIRTLFTGVRATTESVTTRSVQRERWSASDLAHQLPPRHAVVSLTTVRGEASPPVLVDLDS